jgi:hypothetical protein
MRKMSLAVAFVACAAFVTSGFAGDSNKVEPRCPVSGKKIDEYNYVKFNGGKVYFGCENCPIAFAKEKAGGRFAAKANYQLYVTKQATLNKCPFTGEKLNTDTKISVSGMDVFFCCAMCQAKVKEKKTDDQIEMIFSTKNFKKGFEVKSAK